MGRTVGAVGYVVVALVFGPIALLLYRLALRLLERLGKTHGGRHRRSGREPEHERRD